MKDFICVTSMTPYHIEHIGKYMIESWSKYWPENSKLIVYAEEFTKENITNVEFVDWKDRCFSDWQNYCHNEIDVNSQRFAKKGFSFLDALSRYKNECKQLVWLDTDLLCKKPIHKTVILNLVPQSKLIGLFDFYYQNSPEYTLEEYVDTNTRKQFGAESGFVIVNTNHMLYDTYVNNYRSLYISDTKHSSLTSWFDGEVVLSAARNFLDQVEDLSQLRTTNKTQTPLNRSYLSDYMIHIKAKVKKTLSNDDFKRIINDSA